MWLGFSCPAAGGQVRPPPPVAPPARFPGWPPLPAPHPAPGVGTRNVVVGLLALAGTERTHHRGDIGQGATADQGGSSVFNTADDVRGKSGHGLAPVFQGMASSFTPRKKYTIHNTQKHIIHFIHTVQNLYTDSVLSLSAPKLQFIQSNSEFTSRVVFTRKSSMILFRCRNHAASCEGS